MLRKGPRYTRSLSDNRGPRLPHDPTWLTRPHQPSPNGGIHLANSIGRPPPATTSSNYLLTIRSRKPRFGRTRTSDTVRSHEATTAMGRTDVSDCKKPSASCVCFKYSCHPFQESNWTNPGMLHRIWCRYILATHCALIYCNIHLFINPSLQIDSSSFIKLNILSIADTSKLNSRHK